MNLRKFRSFSILKERRQDVFHIGIDGGKRMHTAEHHGTARIFAGNEHIRKLKQRDHLSGRDIKSFVVRARCDIQRELGVYAVAV